MLTVTQQHRNKHYGSKALQGLLACAQACHFDSIDFYAQCIDQTTESSDPEFELALRYNSILHFYAKHGAKAHQLGKKPIYRSASIAHFATPLTIHLNQKTNTPIWHTPTKAIIQKQQKKLHNYNAYRTYFEKIYQILFI